MPRAGTTSERDYGWEHQQERERWRPIVERGEAFCHAIACLEERDGRSRWIVPGTPWHLGHDRPRLAWTGPEHQRCNTSDGGTRSGRHGQRRERQRPRPRRPIGW